MMSSWPHDWCNWAFCQHCGMPCSCNPCAFSRFNFKQVEIRKEEKPRPRGDAWKDLQTRLKFKLFTK